MLRIHLSHTTLGGVRLVRATFRDGRIMRVSYALEAELAFAGIVAWLKTQKYGRRLVQFSARPLNLLWDVHQIHNSCGMSRSVANIMKQA